MSKDVWILGRILEKSIKDRRKQCKCTKKYKDSNSKLNKDLSIFFCSINC